MNTVETRFSEVKYTTSDPQRMLNRFLSKRVIRTYTESYIDKNSGQVIPIEHTEVLFEKGTYIDTDILTQINFFG